MWVGLGLLQGVFEDGRVSQFLVLSCLHKKAKPHIFGLDFIIPGVPAALWWASVFLVELLSEDSLSLNLPLICVICHWVLS